MTPTSATLTLALLAIVLTGGLLAYHAITRLADHLRNIEHRLAELEAAGKQRQDHYTRAGLLDGQANLIGAIRDLITAQEYIQQAIGRGKRIEDIYQILIADPKDYPKDAAPD